MKSSRARLVLISLFIVNVSIGFGQEPKRHCRAADWPKRLPALDAVLDSAALFDLVDTSSASDTTSIVVSILYKEDGTAVVRLLEPTAAPSPLGTFLLQNVSRGLRRLPPPSPLGALRVRMRAGPGRAGTVERSVYCPPAAAPLPGAVSGIPQTMRVEVLPGDRPPTAGRVRVDVQTLIDEIGNVTDVRLLSTSGLRELDESIVAEQRRRIFLPATIDGVPVSSWTRSNGSSMRL